MFTFSIIVEDQVAVKDGTALHVDMEGMPKDVRAVQWDGQQGHEELTDMTNVKLYDFYKYQFIVDRWDKKYQEVIANPPDPTPEEIQEDNRIKAIGLMKSIVSILNQNEDFMKYGLTPFLTPDDEVYLRNYARIMESVAVYPPDFEYAFDDVSYDVAPPDAVLVRVRYNATRKRIVAKIITAPPGYDADMDEFNIFLGPDDEQPAVSKSFHNGRAVINHEMVGKIYFSVNDNPYREEFTGTADAFYIYR